MYTVTSSNYVIFIFVHIILHIFVDILHGKNLLKYLKI